MVLVRPLKDAAYMLAHVANPQVGFVAACSAVACWMALDHSKAAAGAARACTAATGRQGKLACWRVLRRAARPMNFGDRPKGDLRKRVASDRNALHKLPPSISPSAGCRGVAAQRSHRSSSPRRLISRIAVIQPNDVIPPLLILNEARQLFSQHRGPSSHESGRGRIAQRGYRDRRTYRGSIDCLC